MKNNLKYFLSIFRFCIKIFCFFFFSYFVIFCLFILRIFVIKNSILFWNKAIWVVLCVVCTGAMSWYEIHGFFFISFFCVVFLHNLACSKRTKPPAVRHIHLMRESIYVVDCFYLVFQVFFFSFFCPTTCGIYL